MCIGWMCRLGWLWPLFVCVVWFGLFVFGLSVVVAGGLGDSVIVYARTFR